MVLLGLKRGLETGAGESFNMMILPAGITSRVCPRECWPYTHETVTVRLTEEKLVVPL